MTLLRLERLFGGSGNIWRIEHNDIYCILHSKSPNQLPWVDHQRIEEDWIELHLWMESIDHRLLINDTEFCWYVCFVITHASQLISIEMVATGLELSMNHRNKLPSLRILDKKDEIIPVPGPISNKRDGWSDWRNEYSCSRASKKRNESWSGSYLFVMNNSLIIHFGVIIEGNVIKSWSWKERRIHFVEILVQWMKQVLQQKERIKNQKSN